MKGADAFQSFLSLLMAFLKFNLNRQSEIDRDRQSERKYSFFSYKRAHCNTWLFMLLESKISKKSIKERESIPTGRDELFVKQCQQQPIT